MKHHIRQSFVNLGSLYTSPKHKRPASWAYFDDGSIFVDPFGWVSHDKLQQRMKIVAQFVQTPSPRMQAIRREDPHRQRLILVTKSAKLKDNGRGDEDRKCFRILARNARDREHATAFGRVWEHITITLNPTVSPLISVRAHPFKGWNISQRNMINDALDTFRGTLIDGTLQPNVRLGNGLCIENEMLALEPQMEQETGTQEAKTNGRSEDSPASTTPSTKAPARPLIRTYMSPTQGRPPPPKMISHFSLEVQQSRLQKARAGKQEQEPDNSQQQLPPQSTHDQNRPQHTSAPPLRKHTVFVSHKQDTNSNPHPYPQNQNLRQTNNLHQSIRKVKSSKPKPAIHNTNKPLHTSPYPDGTPSFLQPKPNMEESSGSIISTPAPNALAALRSRTNES